MALALDSCIKYWRRMVEGMACQQSVLFKDYGC